MSLPIRRDGASRGLAVVLLLLGVAAFAACGDDDDDDDAAAVIALEGLDFAFRGVPASLDSGDHTFSFENTGSEVHEAILLKLPEGMTLQQALELPEEEADEILFSGVVAILFAQPGQSGTATITASLTTGTYGFLCFIENENGPHAIQGMVASFDVGS